MRYRVVALGPTSYRSWYDVTSRPRATRLAAHLVSYVCDAWVDEAPDGTGDWRRLPAEGRLLARLLELDAGVTAVAAAGPGAAPPAP